MNKFLVVLLLAGLASGGCQKKEPKPVIAPDNGSGSSAHDASLTERADVALRDLGEKTREAVTEVKGAFDRRDEGRSDPLRAELEKNGRVIREKAAAAAGDKIITPADSARIVAVVKGKLVADREIFASKIQVNADQGVVTLTGSVGSSQLLGRAIQLALDTEGVNRVVSLLTIDV